MQSQTTSSRGVAGDAPANTLASPVAYPVAFFESLESVIRPTLESMRSEFDRLEQAVSDISELRKNANYSWEGVDVVDFGLPFRDATESVVRGVPDLPRASLFSKVVAVAAHAIRIEYEAGLLKGRIDESDRHDPMFTMLIEKQGVVQPPRREAMHAAMVNLRDACDATARQLRVDLKSMLVAMRQPAGAGCTIHYFTGLLESTGRHPEEDITTERSRALTAHAAVVEFTMMALCEGFLAGMVSKDLRNACMEKARRIALNIQPLRGLPDTDRPRELDIWVDPFGAGYIGASSAMYRVCRYLHWVRLPLFRPTWYKSLDELFSSVVGAKVQSTADENIAIFQPSNDDVHDPQAAESKRLSPGFIKMAQAAIVSFMEAKKTHLTVVVLDCQDDEIVFDYNRIRTVASKATDPVTPDLLWQTKVHYSPADTCPSYVSPIGTVAHVINGLHGDVLEPRDIGFGGVLVMVVRKWKDKFVLLGTGGLWEYRALWLTEPDFSNCEEALLTNASIQMAMNYDDYYVNKSDNVFDYRTRLDALALHARCVDTLDARTLSKDFWADMQPILSSLESDMASDAEKAKADVNDVRQRHAEQFLDKFGWSVQEFFTDILDKSLDQEAGEIVLGETMLTLYSLIRLEIGKIRKSIVDVLTSQHVSSAESFERVLVNLLKVNTVKRDRAWKAVLDLVMRKYYVIS